MEKGRVYEVVYLTEEEKIVVDAIRAGANVDIYFTHFNQEQMEAHMHQIPEDMLPVRGKSERQTYVNHWAKSKDEQINLRFLINKKSH